MPDSAAEGANAPRMTQVARWQQDNLWLAPNWVFGNPAPKDLCYNTFSGTLISGGSGFDCNHRPVAVILPSGGTLVFYEGMDNYAGGGAPGNTRVSVLEFK